MTNYEHYKKDIERITNLGMPFAFSKNTQEVELCNDFECKDCLFFNTRSCDIEKFKWGYEEHQESEIDWSKVPVDTKILVKNSKDAWWHPRYFAKYEDGKVYAWDDGATSFSTDGLCTCWNYAKLAEEEA